MKSTKLAQEQIGWRWIAGALVLAVCLAGALIMSVAAQISPPANTQHTTPNAIPAQGSKSVQCARPRRFRLGLCRV